MKPRTPMWLLRKYRNAALEKLVPLKSTKIDELRFYHLRKGLPQDPRALSIQGMEFHNYVDKISGETAVDVGANIGSYTLRISRNFGRVIAFEPNPAMSYILRLNVRTNRLHNIQV